MNVKDKTIRHSFFIIPDHSVLSPEKTGNKIQYNSLKFNKVNPVHCTNLLEVLLKGLFRKICLI